MTPTGQPPRSTPQLGARHGSTVEAHLVAAVQPGALGWSSGPAIGRRDEPVAARVGRGREVKLDAQRRAFRHRICGPRLMPRHAVPREVGARVHRAHRALGTGRQRADVQRRCSFCQAAFARRRGRRDGVPEQAVEDTSTRTARTSPLSIAGNMAREVRRHNDPVRFAPVAVAVLAALSSSLPLPPPAAAASSLQFGYGKNVRMPGARDQVLQRLPRRELRECLTGSSSSSSSSSRTTSAQELPRIDAYVASSGGYQRESCHV